MKSKLLALVGSVLLTAFFVGSTVDVQAQTKQATEAAEAVPKTVDPNRKLPFYAKVAAVDKANKTLKIGNRTFKVMPDTKMIKNEKSATLDDATIGEISGGSYKNNNGTLELVMIRFGPKPETVAKTGGSAKK